MVRKIRAKLVLRLRAEGFSGRQIAAQGMSRHSVAAVLEAADREGVGFVDVARLLTVAPGSKHFGDLPGDRLGHPIHPGWVEPEETRLRPIWSPQAARLVRDPGVGGTRLPVCATPPGTYSSRPGSGPSPQR